MAKKLSRGITRKNANEVISYLYKTKDEMMLKDAKNICSDVGRETLERIRAQAPIRLGELLSSIKLVDWSNRLRFRLEVDVPYAKCQNTGSKAHTISANNADFLHFWWENRGVWFTGKSVNHPGTEGNRFFSDSVDWCQKELYKRLKVMCKKRGYKK